MQTSLKIPEKAIIVDNGNSNITLKINKRLFANSLRKVALILLFAILGVFLVLTYTSQNPQFWPLLKVAAILSLIGIIALKSSNPIKEIK
ncbi:MAG: hypothetical protein QNJ57_06025 [Flavobacteriaceae bacterium]|nr:hypothetical protein [Flavobacteriaceae bacterium]